MQALKFTAILAALAGGTLHAQLVPTPPASSPSFSRIIQSAPAQSSPPSTSRISGSILSGPETAETLPLSLKDAIDRGVQYNLGVVSSEQNRRLTVATRLQALSLLLPNLTSRVSETSQQVNLQAVGFKGLPGIPTIVGPFQVFDARAALTQNVYSFSALSGYRGVKDEERAAIYDQRSTRDAVVFAVVSLYLQAQSNAARIDAAEAQVAVATASLNQARSLNQSGVVAGIDVLRAQVELQTEQNALISARNDLARSQLDLVRAIGLAPGQSIKLTDDIPFAPPPPLPLEEAIASALVDRSDLQAAVASEQGAEQLKRAAAAQRLPSIAANANYGLIGQSPTNAHGTYSASIALELPIFDGGRIRSDIERADAVLQQRHAESSNLRGQIEYEVRTAFLDLTSARERVDLARSTLDLAQQQLVQARDRFQSGVSDNLEVVQAQTAVTQADETVVASLFAYNVAKALLARSVGSIQQRIFEFLGVNP